MPGAQDSLACGRKKAGEFFILWLLNLGVKMFWKGAQVKDLETLHRQRL